MTVKKAALMMGLAWMLLLGWLQAERPKRDDRGSDSTEKAWMIGLAIGIGGIVVTAATAYVVAKTDAF